MQQKIEKPLTAPFPWFGGKRKVASLVWERFGDVATYVEPFGGSLAVLLGRPDEHHWWHRVETVGDVDGHLVNFWRAIAAAPEEVAQYANWPVTEIDLTARHYAMVNRATDLAARLTENPDYYDTKAAGWWVWGICAWVGGDWMTGLGPYKGNEPGALGVYRKMPMVDGTHPGKGTHRVLSDPVTPGEPPVPPDVPEMYLRAIQGDFTALANRLRRVRVTCGSWERLTRSAVKPVSGKYSGVFLDPPYDPTGRRKDLYAVSDHGEGTPVHVAAREWALEAGKRPELRIAYCSHLTDEEESLFTAAGWVKHSWQASGGYGLQADNRARQNRDREVIWFSPNCAIPPR